MSEANQSHRQVVVENGRGRIWTKVKAFVVRVWLESQKHFRVFMQRTQDEGLLGKSLRSCLAGCVILLVALPLLLFIGSEFLNYAAWYGFSASLIGMVATSVLFMFREMK